MSNENTGNLDARVDRLETGQDTLSQKIDQILGIVKGPGRPNAEGSSETAGRPDIESQVRAELERAERERAAQQAADDEKNERETLKQQLAKLQETAPVAPQPRSQRMMWGPR